MTRGFDLWATQFDGWRGPAKPEEIDALHEILGESLTLLDVGGGTGRYADPLARLGHHPTIFDRSGPMMWEARKKRLDRLVRGDASRLPMRDGSFDAVLFVEMLHLVPDWVGAVHEMGRVGSDKVVAVIREREPDHRRILLETRAEMGMPTGLLDEGVRALVKMIRPKEVRTAWTTRTKVDLVEPMRRQEVQAGNLGEPRFPDVVQAAIAKVVEAYGSTKVEQVETGKVALWDPASFRSFTPSENVSCSDRSGAGSSTSDRSR
ncbi:MAG: class I SAM-dependent methyltransferase [Euryarchaeota archaeon]|nr:class I SAM-dependent methyltransferase [Euryarchaeota archaeon]MDE1835240.1 class I SAM-dependent methyltransferase [Euryarchaeota archaeon]MDE1881043.1 class I SAM-dependent methyltransferase [Euryarchaeota archaeon]MDE2043536.1 class I SAM-dependent methyltransferase [Thermoplasmata archaeon]